MISNNAATVRRKQTGVGFGHPELSRRGLGRYTGLPDFDRGNASVLGTFRKSSIQDWYKENAPDKCQDLCSPHWQKHPDAPEGNKDEPDGKKRD